MIDARTVFGMKSRVAHTSSIRNRCTKKTLALAKIFLQVSRQRNLGWAKLLREIFERCMILSGTVGADVNASEGALSSLESHAFSLPAPSSTHNLKQWGHMHQH
jgi:hypothetical protein